LTRSNDFICIILTGLPGSGKTTCGALLGKALNLPFCDTDEIIESTQSKTIKEIFAEHGEDHFRALERDTLKLFDASFNDEAVETGFANLAKRIKTAAGEAQSANGLIISVGGGVPEPESNRELLKRIGTVVYLFAEPEEIGNRLKNTGDRPLLTNQNDKSAGQVVEKLTSLLDRRSQAYDSADIKIDTTGLKPRQIVKRLQEALERQLKI